MYVSASHSTVLSPSGVTSVTVNAATMLVLADDDDDADFVRRPPAAAGRAARTGRAAFAFAATLRVRTAVTRPDLITLPAIFPSLYSSSSTYLHYFAFVVLSASLAISLSLSLSRPHNTFSSRFNKNTPIIPNSIFHLDEHYSSQNFPHTLFFSF